MKKLLLLLVFASFWAQGQLVIRDSVYVENNVNKVKFDNTIYNVIGDQLFDSYDDYFWVDGATIERTKNRYHARALRISFTPSTEDTPDGQTWAHYLGRIPENTPLRIGGGMGDVVEHLPGTPDIIIGHNPQVLDNIQSGDLLEVWRLGTLTHEYNTQTHQFYVVGVRAFGDPTPPNN